MPPRTGGSLEPTDRSQMSGQGTHLAKARSVRERGARKRQTTPTTRAAWAPEGSGRQCCFDGELGCADVDNDGLRAHRYAVCLLCGTRVAQSGGAMWLPTSEAQYPPGVRSAGPRHEADAFWRDRKSVV